MNEQVHAGSSGDRGDADFAAVLLHCGQRLPHPVAPGFDVAAAREEQRTGAGAGGHGACRAVLRMLGMPRETVWRALRMTVMASRMRCWSSGVR
jgi:hypothetical protein